MAADVPPNQTIYVRNLNEKVKKEELKKALYAVFQQFGPILDVVALKTVKMRGQAFIVFADVGSATSALRAMQGFPFYGKPMTIAFAKTKSDAVAREEGTYEQFVTERRERAKLQAEEGGGGGSRAKRATAMDTEGGSRGVVMDAPPNKILLLTGLPSDTTADMLVALFDQFKGYLEVRLVPGRPDLAFVEFEAEQQAAVARDSLQGFKITPTHPIAISFARA